jgi:hypothetical protein
MPTGIPWFPEMGPHATIEKPTPGRELSALGTAEDPLGHVKGVQTGA